MFLSSQGGFNAINIFIAQNATIGIQIGEDLYIKGEDINHVSNWQTIMAVYSPPKVKHQYILKQGDTTKSPYGPNK